MSAPGSRSAVVSSFTIIKGALADETYAVFQDWDFALSKKVNLDAVRESNRIGMPSLELAPRCMQGDQPALSIPEAATSRSSISPRPAWRWRSGDRFCSGT